MSHLRLVLEAIEHYYPGPMLMFIAGDMTQDEDSQSMWNQLFRIAGQYFRTKTLMTALGNHDGNFRDLNCPGLYPKYFQSTFKTKEGHLGFHHSLIFDNILVISLADLEEISLSVWDTQLSWMEDILKKYDYVPIKILLSHRPYFFPTPDLVLNDPYLNVLDIVKKYNVNFIVNGHDHVYRRMQVKYFNSSSITSQLTHFVVGGGGGVIDPYNYWADQIDETYQAILQASNPCPHFLLFSVRGQTIIIKAQTLDGSIIDTATYKINNQKLS